MGSKKDITNTDLVKIEPITDNQKLVFDLITKGQHQFMFGSLVQVKHLYHSIHHYLKCYEMIPNMIKWFWFVHLYQQGR